MKIHYFYVRRDFHRKIFHWNEQSNKAIVQVNAKRTKTKNKEPAPSQKHLFALRWNRAIFIDAVIPYRSGSFSTRCVWDCRRFFLLIFDIFIVIYRCCCCWNSRLLGLFLCHFNPNAQTTKQNFIFINWHFYCGSYFLAARFVRVHCVGTEISLLNGIMLSHNYWVIQILLAIGHRTNDRKSRNL